VHEIPVHIACMAHKVLGYFPVHKHVEVDKTTIMATVCKCYLTCLGLCKKSMNKLRKHLRQITGDTTTQAEPAPNAALAVLDNHHKL
jgi:hypothetical protein